VTKTLPNKTGDFLKRYPAINDPTADANMSWNQ